MPYRSANAVGPHHCSVPYRLANAVGPIISPCHTGWPNSIPIRAIRVGRIRSYPCHTGRPMHLDQIIPRAIQVGRIQYLSMPYRSANAGGPNHCSVPYRVAGSDTYPCHTGRPMHLARIISPWNTGWPDTILSASYRLAGSDTYPCHTGQPTKLAQIISLCHTCRPIQFPPIISPMSYQLPECTT